MTYTVKNRTETISNQIKLLVSLWMTQYDTTYIEVTTTQMKVVLIIIRRPLRFNCDSFRDQDPRVWNHTEYKECNETQKTKQNLWMKLSWNRKCAAVDSECDVYTSNSSSSPLWGSEALRLWADVGAPSQNLWNQQQQTTAGRVESSTETNTAPSAAVSSSVSDVTITQ